MSGLINAIYHVLTIKFKVDIYCCSSFHGAILVCVENSRLLQLLVWALLAGALFWLLGTNHVHT